MVKSSQSVDRVFSQFKSTPLADLTLLKLNNNPNQIRGIMNKPNISDAYALALGRLANQYINLLNQPTNTEIAIVQKNHNIILTNDFNKNLGLSGNIPPTKVGPSLPNLKRVLACGGNLSVDKNGFLKATTTTNAKRFLLYIRDLHKYALSLDKIENLTEKRVFVKLLATDGNYYYLSTKWISMNDYFTVHYFLSNLMYIINNGYDYTFTAVSDNQGLTITVQKIEKFEVSYR